MTQAFVDRSLLCVECRQSFTWTANEQREASFFDWWPRSAPRVPRRCPSCREIQKRESVTGARALSKNAYKIPLTRGVVRRAILEARG